MADIDNAVSLMMQRSSYYFYRSYIGRDKSRTAVRICNDLFASRKTKNLESTLLTLALLPSMEWMLQAESLNNMSGDIFGDEKQGERIACLVKTQEMLMDIAGCEPRLLLSRRQDYFARLRTLVETVKQKIKAIDYYPNHGHMYCDLLSYFYLSAAGKNVDTSITTYNVNTYLPDAISLLHDMLQASIPGLINTIIESDAPKGDADLQYVYHNTLLLVDEYCKILWYANSSDDKAMQLLSCDTETEMLELTQSDTKYYQAYIIVEYVKLIHNAIELLKSFPQPIYDVVARTIAMRPKNCSETDIANSLNMSLTAYRTSCKNGMAVLSTVLFGYNCDVFLDMLMDS